MKNKKDIKEIMQFICEAGMLKNVKRSGWQVLGIRSGETVAEHSFRCAVIGYILADMEGASAHKVILLTLFNDIQEARMTDLHKMAQRYLKIDSAEDSCFTEQIKNLPDKLSKELAQLHEEYRKQKTKESIIARDADILECLIQAKEYHEQGFKKAIEFTKCAPRFLKSNSAKKLWQVAKNNKITNWWVALSNFKR
ncbi:MAG: HD domain-containing protein [Candidatus Omnitrophica bacterium]|jgi:putative hydrolase of HD superfamily|nr:HD domain-containing protein [Candidatus Omnitrophota bacterium]